MATSELEVKVISAFGDPSATEVFYAHLTYPTTFPYEGATRTEFSAISDRPLCSKDYGSCVGIALVGDHRSALTHHSKLTGNPRDYIPELVEELKAAGEWQIVAAVMGGNLEHMETALEVLAQQCVPVIGLLQETKGISGNKLMVVLPSTREVIAYGILNGGYQQLMNGGSAVHQKMAASSWN